VFCDVLGLPDLKADPGARDEQSARRAVTAARCAARAIRGAEADEPPRSWSARGCCRADPKPQDPRRPALARHRRPADAPPDGDKAGQTDDAAAFTTAGRPHVRIDPPRLGEHTRCCRRSGSAPTTSTLSSARATSD
jgi:hypothetical protein